MKRCSGASASEIFDPFNGIGFFRIDDIGCAKPSSKLELLIADIDSDDRVGIDNRRCRNRAEADPA